MRVFPQNSRVKQPAWTQRNNESIGWQRATTQATSISAIHCERKSTATARHTGACANSQFPLDAVEPVGLLLVRQDMGDSRCQPTQSLHAGWTPCGAHSCDVSFMCGQCVSACGTNGDVHLHDVLRDKRPVPGQRQEIGNSVVGHEVSSQVQCDDFDDV